MDQKQQQKAAQDNEMRVEQWFKESGFQSQRLGQDHGIGGKNADWRFEGHEITLVCEVKTIFSGVQDGLTSKQKNRHDSEYDKKMQSYRQQAGMSVNIDAKPDLKVQPNPLPNPNREAAITEFQNKLRETLEADPKVGVLPFDIVISMHGMQVLDGANYQEFLELLKGFIVRANEPDHVPKDIGTYTTFTYTDPSRTSHGKERHVEVGIQIYGPVNQKKLRVQYLNSYVAYNEEGVHNSREKAMEQLKASIKQSKNDQELCTIAFWSESFSLSFSAMLIMDVDNLQLGRSPDRYHLFDWAFSDSNYSVLDAIFLFEMQDTQTRPHFYDVSDPAIWVPRAFVIPNPHRNKIDLLLKRVLTHRVKFLEGISSDPLSR